MGFLYRKRCRKGFSLVEMLVSVGVVSALTVGVGAFIGRTKKIQVTQAKSQEQSVNRAMLLEKLSRDLNQSKVARYLNLPVLSSACSSNGLKPSLSVFKDGKLICATSETLGIKPGHYSIFSDTISALDPTSLVARRIFATHDGAAGTSENNISLVNQSPQPMDSADMDVLRNKRVDQVPLAVWPLVNNTSQPFVFLKQKELPSALRYRYAEDYMVQPSLAGEYPRYLTVTAAKSSASQPGFDVSGVVGGLALIVNEAHPEQYFVKVIDRALMCASKTPYYAECQKIACGAHYDESRLEDRTCRFNFENQTSYTHYLLEFSSANANANLKLRTDFLPKDYYTQEMPAFWMLQESAFFLFPTQVASMYLITEQRFNPTHGNNQARMQDLPLVQGDVDLKKIFTLTTDDKWPELRTNWQVIPVSLARYYLEKAKTEDRSTDGVYNLVSQVFHATENVKPQVVTRIAANRIVFARELGTSTFTVYEDDGRDLGARNLVSVALTPDYLPPTSTTVASYPIRAPAAAPVAAASPRALEAGADVLAASGAPAPAPGAPQAVGHDPEFCGGDEHACRHSTVVEMRQLRSEMGKAIDVGVPGGIDTRSGEMSERGPAGGMENSGAARAGMH